MSLFNFTLPIITLVASLMNINYNITSNTDNKAPEYFHHEKKSFSYPVSDSSEPGEGSQNGITNIANMFNERGFYKSNGFSIDDQEVVNDFNEI